MVALDPEVKIRQLLGEDIPENGTAADTLFTEAEISDLLEYVDEDGDTDRAVYEGWRVKAAKLSSLVDNTEGNVQRKFSQLLANAEKMTKMYYRSSGGPTEGRTRIGRAKRAPIPWR